MLLYIFAVPLLSLFLLKDLEKDHYGCTVMVKPVLTSSPFPTPLGRGLCISLLGLKGNTAVTAPVSSIYSPARIQAFHDADPDSEIFASIKDLLQLITVVLHPFSQGPCFIKQHFQKVVHPERAGSSLSDGNQAHIFHRR